MKATDGSIGDKICQNKRKKRKLAEIVDSWIALPDEERQTEDQAPIFSIMAQRCHGFHDYQEILGRLGKNIGGAE